MGIHKTKRKDKRIGDGCGTYNRGARKVGKRGQKLHRRLKKEKKKKTHGQISCKSQGKTGEKRGKRSKKKKKKKKNKRKKKKEKKKKKKKKKLSVRLADERGVRHGKCNRDEAFEKGIRKGTTGFRKREKGVYSRMSAC